MSISDIKKINFFDINHNQYIDINKNFNYNDLTRSCNSSSINTIISNFVNHLQIIK